MPRIGKRSLRALKTNICSPTTRHSAKAGNASAKCKLYLVAYLFSHHEKAIEAIQHARLGVTGHLSASLRWGNPAKYLSQRHNK